MFPPKHEFGQGTWTGFRQIVGRGARRRRDEHHDPALGLRLGASVPEPSGGSTVASNGTAIGGPPLRQAAAEARRALLGLASAQLGVPVASLTRDDGVVSGGGKTVNYSELLGGKLFNTTIAGSTTRQPRTPMSRLRR